MREFSKLNPQKIVDSLRRAIIGAIDKSMRAIFIEADERAAKVIVYCDGKIPDKVAEDFDAEVMTQLFADLSGDAYVIGTPDITFEFVRLDQPKLIPFKGVCVFALKDVQFDHLGQGAAS